MSELAPVTVLMTVYNGGRFLSEAIRSILSQGFRDFEFLIVDDASSDGSVDVLKDFAAKDGRIRLILNERNKGQTACLNQGLREARGEWIARQDADDLSLPARLGRQWEAVQKTPGLMIVGVNGWVINVQGKCTGMIHAPLADNGIRWSLPFRNPFIHAGVMFRRFLPDGAPVLYDESFAICQDWELWGRLLESGKGVNLPRRLVAYRHQEDSLSHRSLEQTRRESGMIAGKCWEKAFSDSQSDEEALLSFREGLSSSFRHRFWKLYSRLLPTLPDAGVKQAIALHHLQAAGALGFSNLAPMVAELVKALVSDPLWTIKTIKEGVVRPKRFAAE